MPDAASIVVLARSASLDPAVLGELNTALERHLNTASTLQMRRFLYDAPPAGLGLPKQFIKEAGKATTRLSTDTQALLTLWRKTRHPALRHCLRLSSLRTQLETLAAPLDVDGRLRCSVNVVGTETGRHTASKTAMGTGYNLHTTAKRHKHLILADDDHWIGSVDLSGADGWTIACECAALGDDRMLRDLRAGIKPAQAVALLYQHGAVVNGWDDDRALAEVPGVKDPPWLYMACKRVIWGTAYGMGEQRMAEQILEDSFDPDSDAEPVWVEPRVCKSLQVLVHTRYPGIRRRQDRIRMLLARDGALTRANGSVRTFFGRKTDHSVLKEAYADHPQVMTTWVTELAWDRMWRDPENHVDETRRRVMPLLLVHDSILAQWRKADIEFALRKVRSWFNNPVTIAGVTVTVPFAGAYGRSWGEETEGTI